MFKEKNPGDVVEAVKNIFQEIDKQLNRVGFYVSLKELQARYGDALDKIILAEEQKKNCHYISGEFKISMAGKENYQCSYALYFEDADEKFHVLEAQTKSLDISCLTEDFRQTLQRETVMKFEIEEPSRKNVSV